MIKTWRDGELGSEVKKIIEYNFNVVSKYLSKDIKALTTQERNLISSDYLNENTLVYDTDEEQWYKYSNGSWIKESVNNIYAQNISANDWMDNIISILSIQHRVANPTVQLYMKSGDSFIPVLGGVEIDSEDNVILSTDLPFDGKVVIK